VTSGKERGWSLPPELERLWDEAAVATRRPRPGLNLREIVSTAIAMADRHGIAEVTMAKLAAELGFSTMALYRHVPNKSALVALMVDAAIGEPPSGMPGSGWRDALEWLARGVSRRYRAHPWLLDVPISGPPATPNNVRWLEVGLAALREAPVDMGERVSLWILVTSYVRGKEQLFLDLERGMTVVGEGDPGSYVAFLRHFVDPERFPEISSAIDLHVFDNTTTNEAENDAELDYGLQRVLDGIAVYFASRTPA
jgi:AcrR family transcriptional regulator